MDQPEHGRMSDTSVEIPPRGSRGVRFPRLPRGLMQFMNDMAFRFFRNRQFRGAPGVVALTTTGARSGEPRRSTVAYFNDTDNSWLIVASGGGTATHPAWLYNIAKHPDQVWIEMGRRKIRVTAESVTGEDRAVAWNRITSLAPGFKQYETSTDREIPVLRLRPTI
jgi:deazaflavin-dependent oxidoreductase (nitroreductase family)